MTKLFSTRTHCASLALGVPIALASAPAEAARQPTVLTYFLPKTVVSASVSQQLMACPSPDKVVVGTSWILKAVAVPDYSKPVQVDASSGFLAKRSVALKLNPDGTINAFNSESAGQGGAVIASVLKFAGVVAPMLTGAGIAKTNQWMTESMLLPDPSPCTEATKTLIANRNAAAEMITTLEAEVAKGDTTPAELKLLAAKQEELAGLKAKLTISSPSPTIFEPTEVGQMRIAKLDYTPWFGKKEVPDKVVGSKPGFCLRWAADKAAFMAMNPDGNGHSPSIKPKLAKMMVYRWPVPANLKAGPATTSGIDACELDGSTPAVKAASHSFEFSAPQLSALHSVPVGTGGIFSSRVVKASFDPFGAPLELSYSSDPGAAAIAGTIDAAGGTVTAMRNAELEALNREIALREARKKLDGLDE